MAKCGETLDFLISCLCICSDFMQAFISTFFFFWGIWEDIFLNNQFKMLTAASHLPICLKGDFLPLRTRKGRAKHISSRPGVLAEMVCCRPCWNRLVITPCLIISRKAKLWWVSNLAVLPPERPFSFWQPKNKASSDIQERWFTASSLQTLLSFLSWRQKSHSSYL